MTSPLPRERSPDVFHVLYPLWNDACSCLTPNHQIAAIVVSFLSFWNLFFVLLIRRMVKYPWPYIDAPNTMLRSHMHCHRSFSHLKTETPFLKFAANSNMVEWYYWASPVAWTIYGLVTYLVMTSFLRFMKHKKVGWQWRNTSRSIMDCPFLGSRLGIRLCLKSKFGSVLVPPVPLNFELEPILFLPVPGWKMKSTAVRYSTCITHLIKCFTSYKTIKLKGKMRELEVIILVDSQARVVVVLGEIWANWRARYI